MDRNVKISEGALYTYVEQLFLGEGLSVADARWIALNLIEAELRGVRSHGILLVPTYIQRLRLGGINARYRPTESGGGDGRAAIVIHGDGGPGQALVALACDRAAELAAAAGVGMATVVDSNHCGMLATFAAELAERGLASLITTNTGVAVALPDSSGAAIGNNALCAGFPAAEAPMIVDMALATAAGGKVRVAGLLGEAVPESWLVDDAGRPTGDPGVLDAGGAVTALGGHKGVGLIAMVDLLIAMAGGLTSPEVRKQRQSVDRPMGNGQTVIAFDPGQGVGGAAMADIVERYRGHLRRYRRPNGAACLAPGDPEDTMAELRRREGIPFEPPIVARFGQHMRLFDLPGLPGVCDDALAPSA